MKKTIAMAAIVAALALVGCAGGQAGPSAAGGSSADLPEQAVQSSEAQSPEAAGEAADASVSAITLQADGVSLQMTLADTEAATALAELLREGPVSVDLHPYGGFEKVGSLPQALPPSDEQIETVPGDVMLYQGDQITIFYGSNTWAYTPLGHIEGATPDSLLGAFGDGDITIGLSL